METIIITLFFLFFTIDKIVSFGLDELNIRHIRKHADQVPEFFSNVIDAETYQKSINYTLDKGRFSRWSTLLDTIVILWILFGGVLPWLEQWSASYELGTIWTGIVFFYGFGVIMFVLGLPLEWISIFYIEQKHGFNKMTIRLYIKDKLKEILLTIAISIPCLYVVLWFMMASGTMWWVWTFCFIMLFQLIMLIIYPMFIAPLFNKFKPLEDGELKQSILDFCEKVKFSLIGIFQMDGSKRSSHSNAYFTGISKSRRIVLYDTLINEMSVPQAVAVLAHEIGHYKLNHIKKMIAISALGLLIGLFVLGQIYNYYPLFNAFGMESVTNHGALILFIILSKTFTFYLRPLFSALSRKHEYEADRFAVNETAGKIHMEEALLKLTKQNLSNLTPHPWYSAFYYSHPAIIERIKAIRAI
ncbi:MAG: M48 family metallopeptidase [Candidatus Anammoxibacter sp.]